MWFELVASHLLFLDGNGGQRRPGGAVSSSVVDPWGSRSPRETWGGWVRHTQGTSPFPAGPPGGGLVLDLPQQQFHLMGSRPKWRVENPRALRGERENNPISLIKWRISRETVCQYEQCDVIRSIHFVTNYSIRYISDRLDITGGI